MTKLATSLLGLVLAAALVGEAMAGGAAGFKTTQAPMLTPVAPGVIAEPIMTVGETLASGYKLESIPDGISIRTRGKGRLDVFLNHETSLVPFPFDAATGVGQVDYTNALVSRLSLSKDGASVLSGRYVIPNEANYQRFCSNYLAREKHGFEFPILFTNEEATDLVNRTGTAWPAADGAEQAGLVVAYDIKGNRYRSIPGMGRHNHENSVAIPGYGKPVVLSGDDTFSAPASQLYLYVADNAQAVWDDQGTLYGFKSDNPAVNDYGDVSGTASVSGTFIPVPREVAVGDQTALEDWSNANGVFQFIRIEDIAYDRTNGNVVYLADTGEPRAIADASTGRLRRGPSGTAGPYPNGRIFKLVLDPADPLKVQSLSILVDADTGGSGNPAVVHQPDNLETTRGSLLIQEDPGSHNQYNPGAGPAARIWRYDLSTGALSVVAEVDQSADPRAREGTWESSGIVDASSAFGAGAFLVDVQAHSLFVEQEVRGSLTYKREGGQLILLRIPGA